MNFDEKIDENWRIEILNPKIQNLTKSQNLKSLTLKSKIFNFDKIWPKIKIPPRWFIITLSLRFHQNSMVKILKNLSQYGVTNVTNFFQNFEVDTKIPKSPKLALITKILKKILKTQHFRAPKPTSDWSMIFSTATTTSQKKLAKSWKFPSNCRLNRCCPGRVKHSRPQPRTHKICDIKNCLDKIWWFL